MPATNQTADLLIQAMLRLDRAMFHWDVPAYKRDVIRGLILENVISTNGSLLESRLHAEMDRLNNLVPSSGANSRHVLRG